MWTDNETNLDYLNFRCVADSAAEMIVHAGEQPLSLGVSGGWGVGKSSMLRLIRESLQERGGKDYLFVDFNAWLYQGYDDAKAALMEVIASSLVEHSQETQTGFDKAKRFLKRVNWLRVAGVTAGSALALAFGLPPVGLLGAATSAVKDLTDGDVDSNEIEAAEKTGKNVVEEATKLWKPEKGASPPRQIELLRRLFQETLCDMGVSLVVFIDDLDRCLPITAIATLEAIRLFLFMPRTAFVIAADDQMIRHSVRAHFKDIAISEDLVTNYFDKLVQVPLRVPPLGTQEVRAYMFLLYIQNAGLKPDMCESARKKICERLAQSWRGNRVDLGFVLSTLGNCSDELRANLELADRLAPLMTTAKQIAGNPRLIKRFLNTLSMRLSIARAQHVTVEEASLAKMILFERCGEPDAHQQLVAAISDGVEGKPAFLRDWEVRAQSGDLKDVPAPWNSEFAKDWLALPPPLAEMDLRPAVYVSREHMPIITAADRLSSEAAALLEALLQLSRPAPAAIKTQLKALGRRDLGLMTERLLVRARQVQQWGTPGILWACVCVAEIDVEQGELVKRFFEQVPVAQLQTDIVPALSTLPWSKAVFAKWGANGEIPKLVARAIQALSKES
jgi:predicted KAP-like P-loop ATPase